MKQTHVCILTLWASVAIRVHSSGTSDAFTKFIKILTDFQSELEQILDKPVNHIITYSKLESLLFYLQLIKYILVKTDYNSN